jgi:hypothetical protein
MNRLTDGVGGLILPIVRYFRIMCLYAYIAIHVDTLMNRLIDGVGGLILPIVRYIRTVVE